MANVDFQHGESFPNLALRRVLSDSRICPLGKGLVRLLFLRVDLPLFVSIRVALSDIVVDLVPLHLRGNVVSETNLWTVERRDPRWRKCGLPSFRIVPL